MSGGEVVMELGAEDQHGLIEYDLNEEVVEAPESVITLDEYARFLQLQRLLQAEEWSVNINCLFLWQEAIQHKSLVWILQVALLRDRSPTLFLDELVINYRHNLIVYM